MGKQIVIEKEVMEAAGWVPLAVTLEDEEGTYIVQKWYKGNEAISSYSPYRFVWDCNDWGPNKQNFQRLGLLDLDHEFI